MTAAQGSSLPRVAAGLAGISALLPVLGIAGIQASVLAPIVGFYFFGAGCVLGGLVTLVLAGVSLFLTRGGRDPAGRSRAWLALGVGLVLVGAVIVSAGPTSGLPRINDITNNLSDPPRFQGDPAGRGRDMTYPPEFVPLVRAAYADLTPIHLPAPGSAVYERGIEAAEGLGWEITRRDPAQLIFEASDTSAIFRFVDDVVVRVRAGGEEVIVDVRSKSRDGRGDLGANAARIRAFSEALRGDA